MVEAALETWSETDRTNGYALPASYFYEKRVFDLEKTRIFMRSWHLVAHVNEVKEPGSYVTHELFDQSILVLRGKDGVLRAFHNVCQHRGNRLVNDRRGRVGMVTCGYHAWTYALDGRLRGAPDTQTLACFSKANHGLKQVRLEVFASFVYINLDLDAPSIAQRTHGAEQVIRSFIPDLDHLKFIEEVDVPVAANWKVIQENSIEGYHFDYSGPAHKQLVNLFDFSDYRLDAHDYWWTYIGPAKKGTTEAYGARLAGATWQTDWLFNFGLWPNATIYVFPYSDVVGTFIMIPTGPETSMLRFGYYGAEGRELPEVSKACIRWMNQQLGPEDIGLNISNQKGLRSLGFKQGRLLTGDGVASRSEHLVRHFHELCYNSIRG
jgi:phenylpropionate dioxygenase-like ring-hydroxylating dioxygenase large terminal subunit